MNKQASDIISLLKDMASGCLSDTWASVTKSAIAESILALTKLDNEYRQPAQCVNTPTVSHVSIILVVQGQVLIY